MLSFHCFVVFLWAPAFTKGCLRLVPAEVLSAPMTGVAAVQGGVPPVRRLHVAQCRAVMTPRSPTRQSPRAWVLLLWILHPMGTLPFLIFHKRLGRKWGSNWRCRPQTASHLQALLALLWLPAPLPTWRPLRTRVSLFVCVLYPYGRTPVCICCSHACMCI